MAPPYFLFQVFLSRRFLCSNEVFFSRRFLCSKEFFLSRILFLFQVGFFIKEVFLFQECIKEVTAIKEVEPVVSKRGAGDAAAVSIIVFSLTN